MPFHESVPLLRSTSLLSTDSCLQGHMLSFSDKQEPLDLREGYGYNGMMNMQGNFTNVKEPFTLTQWAELEQQALIYKYIIANVPVPSSLLISIKNSFHPYASLPPTSFGWGTFHLGFGGGNMDPEPGRCRRTDGKKWRCSKDAVSDQKYCDRHINRGRHRSRKHVEVKSSKTVTKAVTKPVTASSYRSLAVGGQYISPYTNPLLNRRVRNPLGSSVYPLTIQPEEEFGYISSDSLLNPNSAKSYGSSYFDFNTNQEKRSGNHNNGFWPEELKPDWTQLSMSTPIDSSPLRLSCKLDLPIQTEETLEKKMNTLIPVSCENFLRGPLGEVLNSTTNSPTLGSSSNSSPVADTNRDNGDYFYHMA